MSCDTSQETEKKAPTVNDITVIGAGTLTNGEYPVSHTAEISLSGNTKIDGNTYVWSYVTNPASAAKNLSFNPNINEPNVTVSGFEKGVKYTLVLTVANQSNPHLISTKSVTIAVTANQAPTVTVNNAVQNVTLSTTPITLRGSSNDSDGTVSSVWTCAAYTPADGVKTPYTTTQVTNLINNASASTGGVNEATVALLKAGTYEFRLTATDNNGATAFERVSVTVNGFTDTKSVGVTFPAFGTNPTVINLNPIYTPAGGWGNFSTSDIRFEITDNKGNDNSKFPGGTINIVMALELYDGTWPWPPPLFTQTFYDNDDNKLGEYLFYAGDVPNENNGYFDYICNGVSPYQALSVLPPDLLVLELNKNMVEL